ncbi:MAG: NifU family protein [Acetobacteraceae bacterium]
MFIETENTPNPATLKFRPGCRVTGDGLTADFASAEAAQGRSPLVGALFAIDGVTGVFLGADFISVTKSELSEWAALKPAILTEIASTLTHGTPVLLSKGEEQAYEVAEQDREVVARICELLDTRVRPVVAGDGGDIVFRGYQDGVVRLSMQGACAGCPSSRATLKHGVENMLRHYVPEVKEVEQVEMS